MVVLHHQFLYMEINEEKPFPFFSFLADSEFSRDTQEKQILVGAIEVFIKYGLRSVTMDDVARELAMSKKTIYKYYSSKAHLIDEAAKFIIMHLENSCESITAFTDNPIDELLMIDVMMRKFSHLQHQAIEFQLKKYYPETYKAIAETKQKHFLGLMKNNLERGIRQGLYREDFDVNIIANLNYARLLMLSDENYFPVEQFNINQVAHEALIYHIRGIATHIGLNYLESKITKP
jgi:AcrR family transcriptional regulator